MNRILVVDDAVFMRISLKQILEAKGYEVVGEAENGMEALKLYEQLRPDLVTMDITMPGINGVETIRKLIELDSKAKIVVCSAMGHKQMVLEAINAGAKDFVVKPFQSESVITAIRGALS
jgi:two-component system chemotaxis response regulator CheY